MNSRQQHSLNELLADAVFTDDPEWFEEHPDRSHRLRPPFPGEIDPACELASYPHIYAVLRQYEPGLIRMLYYVPDDPLPLHLQSDECFIHALFEACEIDLKGRDMPSYEDVLKAAAQLRADFKVAQ